MSREQRYSKLGRGEWTIKLVRCASP
jgi:hypothetical protein